MGPLLIFFAALLALVLYQRLHRKRHNHHASDKTTKAPMKHKKSLYHAVEAHLHTGCCARVKSIKGKRFLASEAPAFPLSGCTSNDCRCDYIHHNDRRQDGRRSFIGLVHDLYGKNGEPERRNTKRRGRRSTD